MKQHGKDHRDSGYPIHQQHQVYFICFQLVVIRPSGQSRIQGASHFASSEWQLSSEGDILIFEWFWDLKILNLTKYIQSSYDSLIWEPIALDYNLIISQDFSMCGGKYEVRQVFATCEYLMHLIHFSRLDKLIDIIWTWLTSQDKIKL